MLVYLLALGSPTFAVGQQAWTEWTSTYDKSWRKVFGQEYLSFAPLFGHQYTHVWMDFRKIQDDYMRGRGLDYFENSRRAVYAQQAYAIANPLRCNDYGATIWGITASDGPADITLEDAKGKRVYRAYAARGTDTHDDCTLAPTATVASIPFAPELAIPAVLEMHRRFGQYIYSKYGFFDAFNPSFHFDVPLSHGRGVAGFGWVDVDYLGIDQGPICAMIENQRTALVWRIRKTNPHIRRGPERAGFPGGWQLGNTWIPEFVALHALEPLDGRLAGSPTIDPHDYFPGIWDTNVVEGKLYGVPWYVDTRLLFYRRDLLAQAGFAAPPRSWIEWQQMLAAIKARAGPDRYSILLPLNEFEPLLVLALQQDEPLLRDDGRFGNFESPGFRRTLQFYVEIFRRGWAPPLTNADVSNVWSEFARGYFSFYVTGPWNIGEFKRRLPAERQESWMTAPLPGPGGPGASIAGGSSLVVFGASRVKAAAWQWIEYLSRPDV